MSSVLCLPHCSPDHELAGAVPREAVPCVLQCRGDLGEELLYGVSQARDHDPLPHLGRHVESEDLPVLVSEGAVAVLQTSIVLFVL